MPSTFGPFDFSPNQRKMLESAAHRRAASQHPTLWSGESAAAKGISMNSEEHLDYRQNPPHTETEDEASGSADEARRIRRLQIMISMVSSVISQDPSLTVEEASELAAGAKRAALAMFPDKELAYDLLYKPRLQRLMRERFRLQ
jgi:hypothetical protein